jgi:hypothetical protein
MEIGKALGVSHVTVGSRLEQLGLRRRLSQAELRKIRAQQPE